MDVWVLWAREVKQVSVRAHSPVSVRMSADFIPNLSMLAAQCNRPRTRSPLSAVLCNVCKLAASKLPNLTARV